MPPYATPFGPTPFTPHDALRVGIARDPLRLLVATGAVRRVLRGVYVDALVPDSLELRARAVAAVVPPGSVVCGRTAAWLWGVDTLAMGAHRVLPRVDVMRPAGASAARRSGAFGSTGSLPERDVLQLAGVSLTTPARTAADLARLLRRPDALASLDALFRLHGVSRDAVDAVLDRFPGYRGVVQARELTGLADARAESPQESRTRLRCIDAGFPAPEPQIEVFDAYAVLVARLDMGWRELLRALEFDGDQHHSTAHDQVHDRDRRRRVERFGWQIAVVTGGPVMSRGLEFERGLSELLGLPFQLTRHHPRRGGWEPRSRWAA